MGSERNRVETRQNFAGEYYMSHGGHLQDNPPLLTLAVESAVSFVSNLFKGSAKEVGLSNRRGSL
jgi:hypothetical protein